MHDSEKRIQALNGDYPNNIAVQCFDEEYFASLDNEKQLRL